MYSPQKKAHERHTASQGPGENRGDKTKGDKK